VVANFAIETT